MDLQPLFETQKKLDDRIVKEKGLGGQDLLDKKILALQVELGELANEWREWKFWSEDRDPRIEFICNLCKGSGEISVETAVGSAEMGYDVYEVDVNCPVCEDIDDDKNPLLEEYVDCLHFILGIGNDLGYSDITEEWISEKGDYSEETTTDTFVLLLNHAADVYACKEAYRQYMYETLFLAFIALGLDKRHLGLTRQEIEDAYYQKNKVNHERQESGY